MSILQDVLFSPLDAVAISYHRHRTYGRPFRNFRFITFPLLTPILTQSNWKDRQGRFSIHYFFDGMCPRDTFLIVSRIEFVVVFLFLCSL